METKESKRARKAKKTAAASALALLTAASVVTGSLFDSPAALLPDDGGQAVVYHVTLDGADDDDAGVDEDESGETRRRGGVRAVLRARILRLPLLARLLVILPLWALGSVVLAAAGALWPALSPALGKLAAFALTLALLAGAFALAAKAVFPDLPLKKLFSRRALAALLLSAAGLSLADAALGAVWADYGQAKNVVCSALFFLALCCVTVPFLLREQRRRLQTRDDRKKAAAQPEMLTFTDAGGTFTVHVPKING